MFGPFDVRGTFRHGVDAIVIGGVRGRRECATFGYFASLFKHTHAHVALLVPSAASDASAAPEMASTLACPSRVRSCTPLWRHCTHNVDAEILNLMKASLQQGKAADWPWVRLKYVHSCASSARRNRRNPTDFPLPDRASTRIMRCPLHAGFRPCQRYTPGIWMLLDNAMACTGPRVQNRPRCPSRDFEKGPPRLGVRVGRGRGTTQRRHGSHAALAAHACARSLLPGCGRSRASHGAHAPRARFRPQARARAKPAADA